MVLLGCFLLAFLATPALPKKHPPSQPIDINRATIRQLQQLPGIGPTRAEAIVEFRLKSGPFKKVDDLLAVPGISKNRLEKLRPYVRIGPPPPTKKSARGAASPHPTSTSNSRAAAQPIPAPSPSTSDDDEDNSH